MHSQMLLLSSVVRSFAFVPLVANQDQEGTTIIVAKEKWVLQLDDEGEIFYSKAPEWINSPLLKNGLRSSYPCIRDWCDHWKQCVWFSKGKGLPVYKDGDVCMDATHTETSISYDFKQRSEVDHLEFSTQDPHINLSPERIAIYGDNHWRLAILKALKSALQKKDSPLCVVADDSIFLTIAAAHLSKKSHIISLFPGLGEKGSQYLKAVADENGFSMDRIEETQGNNNGP